MSKKRFDFRMVIGRVDGPGSGVWHFWSRNSEVYATHAGMGGIEKFSFHTPNVCRRAFTTEHGKPSTLANRATHEWRRDATPPAGSKKVVRVLRIGFGTNVLSTALSRPKRSVIEISPAPPDWSTMLDLSFTSDGEATLREALANAPAELAQKLIVYKELPNGEAFCISSWYLQIGGDVLRMPADRHHKNDLIVFPKDPNQTGRPWRLAVFSNPKDGSFMQVWDFGAYWHPPLSDDEWDQWRKSL